MTVSLLTSDFPQTSKVLQEAHLVEPTAMCLEEREIGSVAQLSLAAKLYKLGIVDELGCIKAQHASAAFPVLLAEELDNLKNFLSRDLIIINARDGSFEIKFALKDLLKHLKIKFPQIEDIIIIGGSVSNFLPPSYIKRCLETLYPVVVDDAGYLISVEEFSQFYRPTCDFDIRISVRKDASENLTRELSNSVVEYLAKVLYKEERPSAQKIQHVLCNAFLKFNQYVDEKTHYFINSFGDTRDKKVDLLHVKSLERDHLFLQDAWGISISNFIVSDCNPLSCIRMNAGPFAWQAILDRLTGSIRARNIASINEFGFPLLLSYITKGRICPEPKTTDLMWEQYLKVQQTFKVNLLKAWVPPTPEKIVDRIVRHLKYCLENHHQNTPWEAFTLTLNTLNLLQNKVKEEELISIWNEMFPNFKEAVKKKAHPSNQETIIAAIHQAISSKAIPFKITMALVQLATFRIQSYQSSVTSTPVSFEGVPARHIRFGNNENDSTLLVTSETNEEAIELLSNYFDKSIGLKDHTGLDYFFRLQTAFEKEISYSVPKKVQKMAPETVCSRMEVSACKYLESANSNFVRMGFDHLLSMTLLQPDIVNITCLLLEEFPRLLGLAQEVKSKKALVKKIEHHLQVAPNTKMNQEILGILPAMSEGISSVNFTDNKLLADFVIALINSQNPHLIAVGKKVWIRYSKKLPNTTQTSLTIHLIEHFTANHPSIAVQLLSDLQKKHLVEKEHLKKLIQAFLESHLDNEPCLLKPEDAVLLKDIVSNIIINFPSKTTLRKQKKQDVPDNFKGIGKFADLLLKQGQLVQCKHLLKLANERFLFATDLQELETLWIGHCEASLKGDNPQIEEAIDSWNLAKNEGFCRAQSFIERRQAAAISICEHNLKINNKSNHRSCEELLHAVCSEEIPKFLKGRLDVVLKGYFDGLLCAGDHTKMEHALESNLASKLRSKDKSCYLLQNFSFEMQKGNLKIAEALAKFKIIKGEMQEQGQLLILEDIYLKYLSDLLTSDITSRNLNFIRLLIVEPDLDILWKNHPTKKWELLLKVLQKTAALSSGPNAHLDAGQSIKEYPSFMMDLLLDIFALVDRKAAPISPADLTIPASILIIYLRNTWKPNSKLATHSKDCIAKFTPLAFNHLCHEKSKEEFLELVRLLDLHQIAYKLDPSLIAEIFNALISTLRISVNHKNKVENLHLLAINLLQNHEFAAYLAAESLLELSFAFVDALLKHSLNQKANVWTLRLFKACDENKGIDISFLREAIYPWINSFINLGDAVPASEILIFAHSHNINNPSMDVECWKKTLHLCSHQIPKKCAEILTANAILLKMILFREDLSQYAIAAANSLIPDLSHSNFECTLGLFQNGLNTDAVSWRNFMRRAETLNDQNKRMVLNLIIDPQATKGVFEAAPLQLAECWHSHFKVLAMLKDPSLETLSENYSNLGSIFGGEVPQQLRNSVYVILKQALLPKLKNAATALSIANRILALSEIFVKSYNSQIAKDFRLADDAFLTRHFLLSSEVSLQELGLETFNKLNLPYDNISPPAEVTALIQILPQAVKQLVDSPNALKSADISRQIIRKTMQWTSSTLEAEGVITSLALVGEAQDLEAGALYLAECLTKLQICNGSKKSSGHNSLSTALKILLEKLKSLPTTSYKPHALLLLNHSRVKDVLSKDDYSELWGNFLLDSMNERPETHYIDYVDEVLRDLHNYILHVRYNEILEKKCIYKAMLIIQQTLIVHNDSSNFIRATEDYINIVDIISFDKGTVEELYQPPVENAHLGFAKAPGLDDHKSPHISNIGRLMIVQPRELSRSPNGHFQLEAGIKLSKNHQRDKFALYQSTYLSLLLEQEPTNDKTKINVIEFVYQQLKSLLNKGLISHQNFILLVEKFAFCPLVHDIEDKENEMHPFMIHLQYIAELTYKSTIDEDVLELAEIQSIIFKLQMWTDMHINTLDVATQAYTTYPNKLSTQQRVKCIKEITTTLLEINTLQSCWRIVHILRNTQSTVLDKYDKDVLACYRTIFNNLKNNAGFRNNPLNYLNLILVNIKLLQSSPRTYDSLGLEVACEFFQVLCHLSLSSISTEDSSIYNFTLECLGEKLFSSTDIHDDVDQYMKLLECLYPCSIGAVVANNTLDEAKKINSFLATISHWKRTTAEQQRISKSLAIWITLLIGTEVPPLVNMGIDLLYSCDSLLSKNSETYKKILEQKSALTQTNEDTPK